MGAGYFCDTFDSVLGWLEGTNSRWPPVHSIERSTSLYFGYDKVSILTNFGVLVIFMILMRTVAT